MLERCRELYNAAIEERRYAYQRIKRDAGYYDRETRQALTREYAATFTKQSEQLPGLKEERPEYQEIYSQVLQDVLRRVDAAFERFFERVKAGKLPGYPRYKSDASYHSFTYPQSGFGPFAPEPLQDRRNQSEVAAPAGRSDQNMHHQARGHALVCDFHL